MVPAGDRCQDVGRGCTLLGRMPLVRTNLTLPADLLAEVDVIAGPRGRSRYVAEAVVQRVRRDRLGRAIQAASATVDNASRLSRDDVSRLVNELRSEETD